MFLSVVFFGNHSAVDIDVQTCTHPMLGHVWGSCCQLVTPATPLAPLSFSKVKTFFVHKLDLKNAKFKDANSNGIYLNKAHPDSLWSFFILPRKTGAWAWSPGKWKILRLLQPKTLDTAAKIVFLEAHLSEQGTANWSIWPLVWTCT